MKPFLAPLEFESLEQAQALRYQLAELVSERPADDPSPGTAVLRRAIQGLDQSLKLEHARATVEKEAMAWEASRSDIRSVVDKFVRQLKKEGCSPASIRVLGALYRAVPVPSLPPHPDHVPVEPDFFDTARYLANPSRWSELMQAAKDRQAALATQLQQGLKELKDAPAAPYPAPSSPLHLKAGQDGWAKALELVRCVGGEDEGMDASVLHEAALYASYGRGFLIGDNKTVAHLYRQSKRDQDSFLATFSPAMIDAAEQFCDAEGLAWQAAQVRKAPRPR